MIARSFGVTLDNANVRSTVVEKKTLDSKFNNYIIQVRTKLVRLIKPTFTFENCKIYYNIFTKLNYFPGIN